MGSRQAGATVQWYTNMPSTMSNHHCFQSAIATLSQYDYGFQINYNVTTGNI